MFFNGQCRLANTLLFTRQATRCKIQFESDMKAMKIKLNGRSWFSQVT